MHTGEQPLGIGGTIGDIVDGLPGGIGAKDSASSEPAALITSRAPAGDEILADPEPVDDRGGDDEVWGFAGDDLIYGFGGDNFVDGGPGGDELITADGEDVILGGPGDDEMQGGRGADLLRAGRGDDEVRGSEATTRSMATPATTG